MKMSDKCKNILVHILAAITLLVLNTAGIVWLVMVMINEEVQIGNKLINITYLSTLETKQRIVIYVFAILGLIASFFLSKFLYKRHVRMQTEKKEDERADKTNKLLEKILDGKK